jgi:hypothetical protein
VVYGVFAVIDAILMLRYGRRSLAEEEEAVPGLSGEGGSSAPDDVPVLTY